jgi:hypothetical protein
MMVRLGFLNIPQSPLTLTLSRREREKRTRLVASLSLIIDLLYKNEPRFFSPLPPGEGVGVRELIGTSRKP